MPIRKQLIDNPALTAKRGEYCGWQKPVMYPKRYLLICCDCGLSHHFQFRIAPGGKIQYRCRRAAGYTKAVRKRNKQRGKKSWA